MAAEEFQESDVIFPDHDQDNYYNHYQERDRDSPTHQNQLRVSCNNNGRKGKKKKQKKSSGSAPVNIPSNLFQFAGVDNDFEEEFDDGDELVPPHVILGRRFAGKMAFSVCTGNGRTLKGRDLSEVRNSILRMTGFLET